ncbi:lambda family phage tail tape measure protein [Donghicola tyrosinivorans]|uniref:Lambda family phage tail tape measure protein n=2 Tax=Donghicola tyrosinivorans TaxID=1652492 RepID=A0A2T0WTZ3_9RHOB|nr:phage tail tape measure protein [Donghicola tyrosinivorans]PRY90147.1 lambda family phage tail tape measure protein [Donghicola tyrosinivorans]
MDNLDDLDIALDRLETRFDGVMGMTDVFEAELARMRNSIAGATVDIRHLDSGISRNLRSAVDAVVLDGARLSDALGNMGQSILRNAYSSAVKPVTDHFGGLLASGIGSWMQGIPPFANGGAFTQGRVMPFANGGVVSQPTTFPMRGATGLMGEAGPEAIMPLTRGADGRLGVQAQGGGQPVQVVMNISTPDAQGFRRSQSQIAAEMGRAIGRGQRNR